MRIPRWMIPLPAIFLSFFPISAKAEPIQGLNTTYYTIDEIPPIQSVDEYPLCGSETENNINRSYDGEPFENCTGDLFMVHMTGFITIPEHNTIEFWLASDDGGEITIDGNTFGVWYDQGCSATLSGELELDAESVPLQLFMYENGGGTCVMLAWNIDNAGWEMVPDDAFTTNGSSTTTSTTSSSTSSTTTTTSTTTSTTIPSTTTIPTTTTTTSTLLPTPPTTSAQSSSTSTLLIETTTTSEPIQTTTTTTTTTTSTSPATTTTTTEVIYTPPQTTTTTEPEEEEKPTTTEPEEEETTTTTEPEETSTTYPDETVVNTVEPDATVPDDVVLEETELETTEEIPSEETTDTTVLLTEDSLFNSLTEGDDLVTDAQVDAVFEEIVELKVINDELFKEILDVLSAPNIEPEQVVAIVGALLNTELSQEQVVSLVSNPEVLQNVTVEQADEIFEEVEFKELSDEEGQEIVDAVQSAPEEIRESFEEKIDVFSGVFDSYVPLGSLIPIGARRTLVVVGAVLSMLPVPNLTKLT